MINFGKSAVLRIAALAVAGTGLSGCVYDVGLGYASDGYYDDYGCDPYGGYDNYYDCDYQSGFYNIGFGGGWYDNYFYPGYGYYLFDNGGRRFTMRDHHRRYWGEKRHNWYRENRGRNRDGDRYRGRGRGYNSNATPGEIGWPERNGGRVRDGDAPGREDRRQRRNDQWRDGDGNGASAVPSPNPDYVRGRGDGRRSDGQGRRRGGDGSGRPDWRGGDGGADAVRPPRRDRPAMDGAGRGAGNGERRQSRQPAPQPSPDQDSAPAYRPSPPAQEEAGRQRAPRQRMNERPVERPD